MNRYASYLPFYQMTKSGDPPLTPNLDKLAREGVAFMNAHCAAPACNPSRASQLFGVEPYTSGIYTNPEPWQFSKYLRDKEHLIDYAQANGYYCVH